MTSYGEDAAHLKQFLDVCRASAPIRRDRCGDPYIPCRNGHIYRNGIGYLVFLSFTDRPRTWNSAKKRLLPYKVTQDGDDEGCIDIFNPFVVPASIIRAVVGLRKRGRSDAAKHLEKYRFGNA